MDKDTPMWKILLVLIGSIGFIMLMWNMLIGNKTSDKNYNSSTYTNYSTTDSEYCEAYGCARKKKAGYIYCDKHLEDINWQPSVSQSSSNN